MNFNNSISVDSRITFDGRRISRDKITHQHLSNLYWFYKIIWNEPEASMIHIMALLKERFNGQLLSYRPHVDNKEEINYLKNAKMLVFIDSHHVNIVFKNEIIGEIVYPDVNRLIFLN